MAFISLIKDIAKMEFKWIFWILCLIAVNIGGGAFFISTLEGKLAIGFMLASFIIMTILHSKRGFVKLLGAAHVLWLAMVPYFMHVYGNEKPSHYKGWLFMVIAFNGISLILDIKDVISYYRGDTAPTVPTSLPENS